MKIVAFVPARGGSKGLPDKNIKLLLGKPLISYAIEAANLCQSVSETYINSDSPEYLQIGKQYGAKTFLRPQELATDEASMQSVLEHFVKVLSSKNESYDAVLVLYPTYVPREAHHLKKIIQVFCDKGGNVPLIGLSIPRVIYLLFKS